MKLTKAHTYSTYARNGHIFNPPPPPFAHRTYANPARLLNPARLPLSVYVPYGSTLMQNIVILEKMNRNLNMVKIGGRIAAVFGVGTSQRQVHYFTFCKIVRKYLITCYLVFAIRTFGFSLPGVLPKQIRKFGSAALIDF